MSLVQYAADPAISPIKTHTVRFSALYKQKYSDK